MEYINTNIKRAAKYLKSYIPLIIINLMLGVLSAAAVAAPVYIIQNLIDDTLNGKDYERLLLICGGLFLLYILKGVVFYYQAYTSEKISSGIVYEIRHELYENLQKLSLKYFSKLKIGDIISRFSNDAQKFRDSLISLSGSVVKIFTIIFLLGKIFLINWKLSLITLIFIPLLAKVARSFAKKLYKTGGEIQRKIGKLTTYLQETILGIAVIKAFAKEDIAIENFKKLNKKNYDARIKNIKVSARVTPLIDLSNVISIIIILLFGGYEVIKTGSMTTGDFMAFLLGVGLLSDPLRVLTKTYNKLTTNLTALERIFEILDKKPEIEEKEGAISLENVNGKIDIKNVSFSYNKEDGQVLKNINLDANLGEVVALVGESGGGKSTLVNLIPRFYNLDEGEIFLDGHDISKLKINFLRRQIGIVPQDTFLFSGTIKSNIAYADENATFGEIKAAAKKANALEFINGLANDFNTEVGERGVLLSGGQKQRIAIARAILKNPRILILDEATSALDTESERLVQDALDKLMKNKTTFVIAHRLSTIINADKIIVMEDGEILERGNHQELIKKNGKYKELYDKQFGE